MSPMKRYLPFLSGLALGCVLSFTLPYAEAGGYVILGLLLACCIGAVYSMGLDWMAIRDRRRRDARHISEKSDEVVSESDTANP